MLQLNFVESTVLIISLISLLVLFVFYLSRKYRNDINVFLVSNRNIGFIVGSFTLAAAWVWAPALLISSQKAYESGLPGIFWFVLPNTLALVLIGVLVYKVKLYKPKGFTLPEFMKIRLGTRNHLLFISVILIVQLYSVVLHLTALNLILTSITSYSRELLILILSISFILIASFRGIRSSVFSDLIKVFFIVVIVALIVPLTIIASGGVSSISKGLGGKSGQFLNIFDSNVFLTFGIAVSISLLSAAVIDQQLWQRGFSIKRREERKAFLWGALIFLFIPILLALLGFIAAGNPALVVKNNQTVGFEVIAQTLPISMVMIFIFTIIIALIAAGSSALCAVSSIVSVDIYESYINKKPTDKQKLFVGRVSMLLILLVGASIALIPNISLVYLLLFIGAIRGALLIPTILSINKTKLSIGGIFYGIILGLAIGLPLFIYGSITQQAIISGVASLVTVVVSAVVPVIMTKIRPDYFDFKSMKKENAIPPIVKK